MDWIKKHIALFTFLMTMVGTILGFVGGMIVSYYKFQSKIETIEFKLDLVKEEFDNIYEVFHRQEKHIKQLESYGD